MKSIDVIGAVLFDDRNDVLAHAGEDRGHDDRRHDANDNSEDCEEAAELVRVHVVQRHGQRFTRKEFRKP